MCHTVAYLLYLSIIVIYLLDNFSVLVLYYIPPTMVHSILTHGNRILLVHIHLYQLLFSLCQPCSYVLDEKELILLFFNIKVCRHILLYPMTAQMHIKLLYFSYLWPHLPPLVILSFIFSSSTFPPRLCPPSCLPP